MRRMLVCALATVVTVAVLIVAPDPSAAVVPGGIGRIAFVSTSDDANGDIYTRDFAGGAWTNLTSDAVAQMMPTWSPDGSRIAYASSTGVSFNIWVMAADGTSPQNLTKDGYYSIAPDWSPDGTRIAYSSNAAGGTDVWVMDADGFDKTNLTSLTAGTGALYPAWSPDGTAIAFEYFSGSSSDIWVMDASGKAAINLTKNTTSEDSAPTWSPDGSQIAFTSDRAGASDELYVMDADGSNERRLTFSKKANAQSPAWSPDGHHIMFTSREDGDADLWMVDPDGSNLGHLTDHVKDEWMGAWESVNRLPVAVDDGPYSVGSGGVLNGGSVFGNDTDPDGEVLVANLVSGPSYASGFTLNPDGTFTYTHDGSTSTSDSFTYTAQDTRSGVSNTATVSITVRVGDTVGLVDPGSGVWRLRDGVEVVTSFYFGNPGDYPFVGDWDCDGTDTPGLYRQSDGFAYLRNTNTQGNANISFFFGNPGDVPIAGDFNADGCDTLSIYRPANQRFYIINELGADGGGLGAADYDFLFGNPGDTPVVGDWDGDGVDEIGLYRESSGFFYYRNTLTTGVADGQFYFGDPGDRFVAGDWGIVDGADTPGLFRPSNQTFYFRHDLTQGNADSQFTWTGAGMGWLPVAGDFDLD
jgi:Tol biopolymer transport system component